GWDAVSPPSPTIHPGVARNGDGSDILAIRRYSRVNGRNVLLDVDTREERMRLWVAVSAFIAALTWHAIGLAAQDAVHVIPEFTFESGEKLAGMKVGYATHGKLNDA